MDFYPDSDDLFDTPAMAHYILDNALKYKDETFSRNRSEFKAWFLPTLHRQSNIKEVFEWCFEDFHKSLARGRITYGFLISSRRFRFDLRRGSPSTLIRLTHL